MNKKISLGVTVALVILAIAVTASITAMVVLQSVDSLLYDATDQGGLYEKLSEIETVVEENYLHTIEEDALLDAVADGYIEGLGDQYSTYYSVEEYEKKKQSNAGVRVGIGVTLKLDDAGYAKIIELAENGTAIEAGIMEGDRIVAVDDNSVLSMTLTEITNLVTGEEGTQVKLSILRDTEELEFTVKRATFDLQTVKYQMIGNVGYIKITGFNTKTTTQFISAVENLQDQGAVGLIFDVRNNGGGLLDAVSKCLDFLVGEGDIVTAEYANGETKVLHDSDSSEVDLPMVVLQNSETASAAELFSATLRDFNKASIVGTQSYGKGVMQSIFVLEDGSAVALTTAKFYPNSMVSFHETGIAPTYEVTLTKEQEEKVLAGELTDDPQLDKAIEILDLEN